MLRIVRKLMDRSITPDRSRRRLKAQLQVESLEQRAVPAGTWTLLTNVLPSLDGAQTMMLLSDGTVMAHGGSGRASSAWYRLSPDSSGSYIKGKWSPLAPMQTARLFFASNILRDGSVFLVGGEYSGPR